MAIINKDVEIGPDVDISKLNLEEGNTNYVILKLDYEEYVLPYKDAMNILIALDNAEKYDTKDWQNPIINDLTLKILITIISKERYQELKIHKLLKVNETHE